jgi:hypothetical protein
MTEPSETPPEAQRFDEFVEISVEGRPVFRIEQVDELSLSDIDDAAIAFFVSALFVGINEELEDEYGKNAEEIIRDREPEVVAYESDSDGWEDLLEIMA